MKYSIDRNSTEPIYIQLYNQLREDITSGRIAPGTRLPSKRLLAEELGVSVISVEHSYGLLTDEGYAAARQRSGYYACFGSGMYPSSGIFRTPAVKISPLSAESTEDFPFSVLARTMRRVINDYDRRILIKPPGSGCPELQAAVSRYLQRSRGLNVDAEQIIIGSGAEYLYGLVAQLLGRGQAFGLEDPCYEKIRLVYEAHGLHCIPLKMGSDGILSAELQNCSAALIHVTPYSSYPSGITASASKRHEYARWAKERNRYIIEDDYDSEFSVQLRQIDTIYSLAPERVIYINTFSKTLAPSMRMGYMVLPEALLQLFHEKLDFYSCTVPVFEQYVLADFLDSGDLERYINRRRRKLRQQMK